MHMDESSPSSSFFLCSWSVNIDHSNNHAGMLELEKGHGCWRIPREGETIPEELESSLDSMDISLHLQQGVPIT